VLARDSNVIQGIIIVVALVYSVVNLLVDLSYGVIDPRTRAKLSGTSVARAKGEAAVEA